jgi:hypothetical protein
MIRQPTSASASASHWAVAAVASELLTNALRHSLVEQYPVGRAVRWPIPLGLLDMGPCVCCVRWRTLVCAPVPNHPGCLDENGCGLQLVESLSDQ